MLSDLHVKERVIDFSGPGIRPDDSYFQAAVFRDTCDIFSYFSALTNPYMPQPGYRF